MAKYRITAPDGGTYEVTAPDDATQEQVLAYAQANYQGSNKPTTAPTPQAQWTDEQINPTEGMSGFEKFAAGMGKSVVDTGRGLVQLGTDAMARSARNAALTADALGMEGVRDTVIRHAGIPLVEQQRRNTEDADEARRLDAPLMNTGAGIAGNITGAALQTAVPVGGGGAAAAALGKAAPYANAAMRGAAYAGAQPVIEGENRMTNAAIGAAAGGIGQGIANVAGSAAAGAKNALSGPIRESIEAAKRAGVPLHVAQVTNSRFLKGLGSVLNSVPLTGSGKAAAAQQQAFNRAVGRTFGVDASTLTDDVMAQAKSGIGQVYDDVFGRNTVNLDRAAINRLLIVEREANKNLTADQARVVTNQVQRIVDEFSNGPIAGQKYQALRGVLADLVDESSLGKHIKGLRTAVDDAAFKSVGSSDAAILKEANRMWANMRTTEKSLQQVSGAAGNVRPSSLFPLVRNGSTGDMRELAKMGQNVLKDPIPNSGTPERQLIYSMLGLGGGAAAASSDNPWVKAAGVGLLAGRAMNSPLAARAVLAAQPARAAAINAFARLAHAAQYALPGVAHATAQPAMEIDVAGGRVGPAVSEAELEELRRRGRTP